MDTAEFARRLEDLDQAPYSVRAARLTLEGIHTLMSATDDLRSALTAVRTEVDQVLDVVGRMADQIANGIPGPDAEALVAEARALAERLDTVTPDADDPILEPAPDEPAPPVENPPADNGGGTTGPPDMPAPIPVPTDPAQPAPDQPAPDAGPGDSPTGLPGTDAGSPGGGGTSFSDPLGRITE